MLSSGHTHAEVCYADASPGRSPGGRADIGSDAPRRPEGSRAGRAPATGWSLRHLAVLGLFAGALFFSLNGIRLSVGPAPIRSLLLIAAGGLLLVGDFSALRYAVNRAARLVAVVLAFGLLGVGTTFVAGDGFAVAMRQVIEIHIQALILIIITFSLAARFGAAAIIKVYFAVFGISAAFAVAQAAGLDSAWEARMIIGRLARDPAEMLFFISKHERAMGLSYSPVVFANELCIAFILAFYLRLSKKSSKKRKKIDPAIIIFSAIFFILSIATGNRSPILGLVVFIPFYLAMTSPRVLLALVPLAVGAALAATPLLETAAELGVRAAETQDGSAQNRKVLRDYGLFLIKKNPIGYGLGFNSLEYAEDYKIKAIHVSGGDAIRYWPVHNYYVNFLAKYGVLSLLILPFVLPWRMRDAWHFLPFIPYAVHIFYHNTGPISGDPLIFFAITIGFFLAQQRDSLLPPESTMADQEDRVSSGRVSRSLLRRNTASRAPVGSAHSLRHDGVS